MESAEQNKLQRFGPMLIVLALVVPLGTAVLVSLINDARYQSMDARSKESLFKNQAEESRQRALVKKLEAERRALIRQFQREKKQAYQVALARHKAQLKTKEKRFDLQAIEMDIQDVANIISEKSELNVLVDSGVAETVTVKLQDITGRKALKVIAKLTDCEIEALLPDVLILTQAPRVTVEFNQANIHTVLQLIAVYAGKSIVVDQNIVGAVTLSIIGVRWDVAVAALAKTCKFHVQQNKGIMILSKAPFKTPWGREPGQQTALPESKTLTLNKTGTLTELANDLSKVSDKPIHVSGATDKKFTVSFRTLPWRVAVKQIEKLSQTELIEGENGYTLLPIGKNFFQAHEAPASVWLSALAFLANKDSMNKINVSRHFTGSFYKVSAQSALEATAHSLHLTVEDKNGILTIHSPSKEQIFPKKNLGQSTEVIIEGKKYNVLLQATLGNQSQKFTMISGEIYRVKDRLRDADDQEIPIRVTAIKPGVVTLSIYDKGSKKPSRTVKVMLP
ncbi:MAG: hypothetical protein P1V97_17335 [Planctomycetota bacterium]|nr:hypothetical protein [Planctomycetota bacterium]